MEAIVSRGEDERRSDAPFSAGKSLDRHETLWRGCDKEILPRLAQRSSLPHLPTLDSGIIRIQAHSTILAVGLITVSYTRIQIPPCR